MDSDLDKLKEYLAGSKWPEAIASNLIYDRQSEVEKVQRGRIIVDLFMNGVNQIRGKRFLDYGCGEGYCVKHAANIAEFALGYDPFIEGGDLTTADYELVEANAPYDSILLFDVLDHLDTLQETPIVLLSKLKSLLNDGGRIFMRCHPYFSRDASHFYHEFNKAFIQLVFTDLELSNLVPNYCSSPFLKINNIKDYHTFIKMAGLKIVNENILIDDVEAMFQTDIIRKRIMTTMNLPYYPEQLMSCRNVDYILRS